jgi:hemolysin activation/secretion protein
VLTPLESSGLYDFNGATDTEMPEAVAAFEPPTARFEGVDVAAIGALDEIAVASFATAYPAKLEDIPVASVLQQEQLLAAAQSPAFAGAAQKPKPVVAQVTPPSAIVPSAPQQLANLDVQERLPGKPLAPVVLARFNAFDESRTMQRFEVTGRSPMPRPLIDDALKAFLGNDRTDEQLQAARDALQRAHDVSGHRVKVILGEQGERDGVARLEVRERKRYSLRIAGELRYDPVTRRNVVANTILNYDEPLTSLTLSRKLSLK